MYVILFLKFSGIAFKSLDIRPILNQNFPDCALAMEQEIANSLTGHVSLF